MAILTKIKIMGRTLTTVNKITVTLVTISTTETGIVLVTTNIIMIIGGNFLTMAIVIAIISLTQKKHPLDKLIMLAVFHNRETSSHPRGNDIQRGWGQQLSLLEQSKIHRRPATQVIDDLNKYF